MIEKLTIRANEIDEIVARIKEKLLKSKNIATTQIQPKDIIGEIEKDLKKPTIFIPADMYTRMFALVHESEVEISWHGLVKRDIEHNSYYIYNLLVFPQENSPTATTTDQDEFAEWQAKLIADPEFPIEDLRMHGHSHVNMQVFSSGTDDAYQDALITNIQDDDYYIFLVLNKRHDICPLVYDYHQNALFTGEDVYISIVDGAGNEIYNWAKEQIKEKCKIARPIYSRNNRMSGGYYGYYGGWDDDDFGEDSLVLNNGNSIRVNSKKPKNFKKGK